MENLLSEKFKNLFATQIIYRGQEYYRHGQVTKCYKTDNGYFAKVSGSEDYMVRINVEDEHIEMSCNCPYGDNCKHEYATLLAIDNGKFKELKLLPHIVKSTYDFAEFVKSIPENELKEFIIEMIEEDGGIEEFEEELKERFFKYLPKESKEYYYNETYNLCLIDGYPRFIINDYLRTISQNITSKDYNQVFTIYSSMIDALYDSEVEISDMEIMDLYAKLGIYARISYRKGNEELKNQISEWIKKYEEKDYCLDVYLEDFLLTIK